MSQWRSLHAFTTQIEPMLIDVVGPFFDAHTELLERAFWERHYVGGPHVRIRLRAAPAALDGVVTELRVQLGEWLAAHPAPPFAYSSDRAANLLRSEGVDPTTEDLEYRNGVVLDGQYPEPGKRFASPGAQQLIEDFRVARGPLALSIMRDPRPRHDAMLRVYLASALFLGRGVYPAGSVSFKSHWEHFAATAPSETVLDRIVANYRRQRERILTMLEDVRRGLTTERFANDPLLAQWWRLLETTCKQATVVVESGQPLIDHPSHLEQVAATRAEFFASDVKRRSDFVEALWSDGRFMTVVQHDVPFQLSRAMVNLQYDLVAAVGLNPIDKMALCHHTFSAVEESCGCDLNDLLRNNIAAVRQRQEHRLETSDEARPPSSLEHEQ